MVSLLIFSNEFTQQEKDSLLNNVQKATHEAVAVWVYKKVNEKFTWLNNKKASYKSKL